MSVGTLLLSKNGRLCNPVTVITNTHPRTSRDAHFNNPRDRINDNEEQFLF